MMRNIIVWCVVFVCFYLMTYVAMRSCSVLTRRLSIHDSDSWLEGNSALVTAFYPAWVVERKSRSLIWRIKNNKPLTGYVNY